MQVVIFERVACCLATAALAHSKSRKSNSGPDLASARSRVLTGFGAGRPPHRRSQDRTGTYPRPAPIPARVPRLKEGSKVLHVLLLRNRLLPQPHRLQGLLIGCGP